MSEETMIKYEWTDEDGDRIRVGRRVIQVNDEVAARPKDPVELHRLTEAIWDESLVINKVAELPEVASIDGFMRVMSVRPSGMSGAERHWYDARVSIAYARHLDARDAVGTADEERVSTEAERLYGLWRVAMGWRRLSFHALSAVTQDSWRAVARDSLARQNGGE